jgi:hypothetical protein
VLEAQRRQEASVVGGWGDLSGMLHGGV